MASTSPRPDFDNFRLGRYPGLQQDIQNLPLSSGEPAGHLGILDVSWQGICPLRLKVINKGKYPGKRPHHPAKGRNPMPFQVVSDFPNEIMNETEGPFISLYQPTHRHHPENQQDPIRFKNLVRQIENSLKKAYPRREFQQVLERFQALAGDSAFWNHTLDGLAILATKDRGVMYKLQRPVREFAVVADSFHVKPLIRIFQSADRYQVLGLSRGEFALYEGNRYGFAPIELDPDVPRTMEDVLGDELDEKHLGAGTFTGPTGVGAYYGHGARKHAIDKYTDRFFRFVDRFVTDNYSKPSGLPLILVSLDEHQAEFRRISRNPHLMEQGVNVAFDALTIEDLRDRVWQAIEPIYLEKTKKLVDEFKEAQSRFMATDDIAQVARAAWEGRVAKLLVDSDQVYPGKVDPESGRLLEADLDNPGVDDVLDDLAEMVFRSKGEVVALPKERMPTSNGAAAIFRF